MPLIEFAGVEEGEMVSQKVLHIVCPGGEGSEGYVITVLPPSILTEEDCPIPSIANVSLERFTPSSIFRCSGPGQVSVIVKNLARG